MNPLRQKENRMASSHSHPSTSIRSLPLASARAILLLLTLLTPLAQLRILLDLLAPLLQAG